MNQHTPMRWASCFLLAAGLAIAWNGFGPTSAERSPMSGAAAPRGSGAAAPEVVAGKPEPAGTHRRAALAELAVPAARPNAPFLTFGLRNPVGLGALPPRGWLKLPAGVNTQLSSDLAPIQDGRIESAFVEGFLPSARAGGVDDLRAVVVGHYVSDLAWIHSMGAESPHATGLEGDWELLPQVEVSSSRAGTPLESFEWISAVGSSSYDTPWNWNGSAGLRAAATGPVRIPAGEYGQTVWLGAPGHAWRMFELASSGLPDTVVLEAGSELFVEVDPVWLSRGPLVLRGQHADGLRLEVAIRASKPLELKGLPGGGWSFLLEEAGRPVGQVSRATLATEALTIETGQPNFLSLGPGSGKPIASELVRIRFEGLRTARPQLPDLRLTHVNPLIPPRIIPGKLFSEVEGVTGFSGRLKDMETGTWIAEMRPLGVSQTFSTSDEGATEVLLDLPEMAAVCIWPVAQDGAAPARLDRLRWRRASEELLTPSGMSIALCQDRDGGIRFEAPVGSLELMVWNRELVTRTYEVEVLPDYNEFTVESETLDRSSVILAAGVPGSIELWPTQRWAQLEIEAVEHEGQIVEMTFPEARAGNQWSSRTAVASFNRPGAYRLRASASPGSSAKPWVNFQVPWGRVPTVQIAH